jgi:hypothetical protein
MERYSDFVIPLLIPLNSTMVLQRERDVKVISVIHYRNAGYIGYIYTYTRQTVSFMLLFFFLFG